MPITLYKLGGSLLDLPDLCARLKRVLSERPRSRPIFLVGGGEAAEIVRRWDVIHHLGDEVAHWLAIEAMALNERLLTTIWPNATLATKRNEVMEAWGENRVPVLSAVEILRSEEATCDPVDWLPRSWEVTSDSIAAWIARFWPARELVLLKSCDAAVATPPVDSQFTRIASDQPRLVWVNLRADRPKIQPWRP